MFIKLSDIKESEDLNRHDKGDVEELSKTLASVGLLQAILVKKDGDKYTLWAGSRRLAAAKLLGWKEIKAELVTDEPELTMVIENLARKDLLPLEEAAGFKLLTERGKSIADIAQSTGKDVRWVTARLALNNLIPEWQKRAADPAWKVGVLELIARLPEHIQREQTKEISEHVEVKSVQNILDGKLRVLAAAPWKLDQVFSGLLCCNACPSRSSVAPDLWSEYSSKKDNCIDAVCYHKKYMQVIEAGVKEAKKSGMKLFDRDMYSGELEQNHPLKKDTFNEYSARVCKPKAPGAQQVYVVNGASAGQVMWVTTGRDLDENGGRQAGPKPLVDRRQALDKRRHLHIIAQVRQYLENEIKAPVKIRELAENNIEQLAQLAALFGVTAMEINGTDRALWKLYKKTKKNTLALSLGVAATFRDMMTNVYNDKAGLENAEEICEIYHLDAKSMYADAVLKLPEPASWKKLNADGTEKKNKKQVCPDHECKFPDREDCKGCKANPKE